MAISGCCVRRRYSSECRLSLSRHIADSAHAAQIVMQTHARRDRIAKRSRLGSVVSTHYLYDLDKNNAACENRLRTETKPRTVPLTSRAKAICVRRRYACEGHPAREQCVSAICGAETNMPHAVTRSSEQHAAHRAGQKEALETIGESCDQTNWHN